MESKKSNLNCEVVVTSTPKDINKTGYDEAPAKYMANPKKWFNDALQKQIDQWRYK